VACLSTRERDASKLPDEKKIDCITVDATGVKETTHNLLRKFQGMYVHTQLKPAIPLTKPKTIHNLLRQIHVNHIQMIKYETRICLIMTWSMNTYGA
jgi:hypothetical protein